MKVKVIGSSFCQDTLFAIIKLKEKGAQVEFRNLSTDFSALKEFLKLRESSPLYDAVKANDGIGMPFFELEDGTQTLDLQEVLGRL
ncbi:MAG: glutaredoxin [Clostridiales bacterium]|nr:glutaredoxin [Clostridiales bacterium]